MPDRPILRSCCVAMPGAIALASVLIFAVAPAAGQNIGDLVTIESRIWGFDGRLTSGQFNPVSFLIDNRTEEPIDAVASLTRSSGVRDVSGRIELPVYIGAGARRWIQFYPYIESEMSGEWEWKLKIGRIEFDPVQQPLTTTVPVDLEKEERGPLPVSVILDAPGGLGRQPATVNHFPEDIFPPWSSATVGLQTVFMDHVPDWEEPRQRALLSWLKRGGRLVLLKGPQGDWPEMTGTLSELSQPLSRYLVGAGVVQRLDVQRSGLTEELVKTTTGRDQPPNPDDELEESVDDMAAGDNSYYGYGYGANDPSWMDDSWSQQLRQLTMPEHAWWLIFLLSLIYILMIFPGCWILSRQNRSFVVVYGAIGGIAVLFSVLFLLIGQRGYGESTTLNTIALSHLEGATQQSVLEWNALFVTSGDEYTVQAPDEQTLFAIPGQQERSSAVFREGNSGGLAVEIPPFSAQTFVCRRQRPVADWQLQLKNVELSSSGLTKVTIGFGPEFDLVKPHSIVVLFGSRVYSATVEAESRSIQVNRSLNRLEDYARSYTENALYPGYGWRGYGSDDDESFYDKIMPGLVIRSVLGEGAGGPDRFRLPPDRLRLFVFADYPDDGFVQTSAECARDGRILYVRDLILDSSDSIH